MSEIAKNAAHRSPVEAVGYEVADVVRQFGAAYRAKYALTREEARALRDIEECRTAALGGHVDECEQCGAVHYYWHSCRNRHCPKCQGLAKAQWVAERQAELLPIPYFHVVFTLDHVFNRLMKYNQWVLYSLLIAVASRLLKEYGERYLGGEIGFLVVLHTWGQKLDYHVHLHCIVMGGALTKAGAWRQADESFLFPIVELSAAFRDAFCAGVSELQRTGQLRFVGDAVEWADPAVLAAKLAESRAKKWEVYAKPPFGGPEKVLKYLGGYVNRIAISNRRLVEVNEAEVRFTYRDYQDADKVKELTLTGEEFLRRFVQHVLPAGFVRIRYYGLWHPCQRRKLAQCRRLLGLTSALPEVVERSVEEWLLALRGVDITRCPTCGEGPLRRIGEVAALRPRCRHRQLRLSSRPRHLRQRVR